MATILTIIPYNFYPPVGGGALRCFYILREMAKHHDVYLLTTQPAEDFKRNFTPLFPQNVHIISTHATTPFNSVFSLLPKKIANALHHRFLKRTLKGPANNYLLEVYPCLVRILNLVQFDIFYYENLEALGLLGSLIKRFNKTAIHIYDAHNVDSELWNQLAKAHNSLRFRSYASAALQVEKSLFKKIDTFFCCSEEDNIKLTRLNNSIVRGTIIPNGVDLMLNTYDHSDYKYEIKNILFCGSLDYLPNKQGISWFYEEVFPTLKQLLPSTTLTVIGSCSDLEAYKAIQSDESVNFIGRVDSVLSYYYTSSVAIVPLLSGSGTRLKILEAMSLGNPVVSTSIGASGLDCKAGEHILIADDPNDFASMISQLLTDKSKFDDMRHKALEFVASHYEWRVIGSKVNSVIKKMLNS